MVLFPAETGAHVQKRRQKAGRDLVFQPTAEGFEIRWRIDGVLQPAATLPGAVAAKVVARLKVLADLLTYRNDVPQEGRIRAAPGWDC